VRIRVKENEVILTPEDGKDVYNLGVISTKMEHEIIDGDPALAVKPQMGERHLLVDFEELIDFLVEADK